MVNGYIPKDPHFPDFTRYDRFADPEEVVTACRHIAIMGQKMLDDVFAQASANRMGYADRLDAVAKHLQAAATQIRDSEATRGTFRRCRFMRSASNWKPSPPATPASSAICAAVSIGQDSCVTCA